MAVSNLVSSSLSASDLVTQPQWTVLGSNTTSATLVSISNIPQTHRTLRVWWAGYDTAGNNTIPYFRINNNLTGNFVGTFLGVFGSSPSTTKQQNVVQLSFFQVIAGNTWVGYVDIEDYASVTATKVIRGKMVGTGSSTWGYEFEHLWIPPSSTAVTSVAWNGSAGTQLTPEVFYVLGAK